jgi:hypothetical protein
MGAPVHRRAGPSIVPRGLELKSGIPFGEGQSRRSPHRRSSRGSASHASSGPRRSPRKASAEVADPSRPSPSRPSPSRPHHHDLTITAIAVTASPSRRRRHDLAHDHRRHDQSPRPRASPCARSARSTVKLGAGGESVVAATSAAHDDENLQSSSSHRAGSAHRTGSDFTKTEPRLT